jgi:hypothetical protein
MAIRAVYHATVGADQLALLETCDRQAIGTVEVGTITLLASVDLIVSAGVATRSVESQAVGIASQFSVFHSENRIARFRIEVLAVTHLIAFDFTVAALRFSALLHVTESIYAFVPADAVVVPLAPEPAFFVFLWQIGYTRAATREDDQLKQYFFPLHQNSPT